MSSSSSSTMISNQISDPNKPIRRPLQPKNTLLTTTPTTDNLPKLKQCIEISLENSNKENSTPIRTLPTPPIKKIIEPFDASLAEELSAIRKKMERMRLEKEKTEKMLDERDLALDKHMEEMDKRWDTQRVFEMEVDKLFRLNQLLRSSSPPIRSMREIQGEKKMKEAMLEAKSEEEQKVCVMGQSETVNS